MTRGFAVGVHREHHAAAGVAVQQDAVRITFRRDAPKGRYASGVDLGVCDTLRFGAGGVQPLADVPDILQAQVVP